MSKIAVPKSFEDRPYAKKRFAEIVAWSVANNPFYKSFFANPENEIPLLTRELLQENNEAILNGNEVTGRTSGSTGVPVRVSVDNERALKEREDNKIFRDWMGGKLPRVSIISMTTHDKTEMNMEINSPLADQVEFLTERNKNRNVTAMLTYPSNAEMLSQYILENEIDMSFIERVICMSEVYEPSLDTLIQKAFPNAQTWSNYSSTETGIIALRCPENRDNHHIMGHKLGVEILNENDEPCAMGEQGRVVLTDFFNTKTPIIRYDIGDIATPIECNCKVTERPALTNIIGKKRGTLLHRDGHRVVFTDLSVAIRDTLGVKQYQVIQEQIENFTVRLVLNEKKPEAELKSDISKEFEKAFGYLPNLTFKIETHIDREPNGKFYASISKV